jgi:hypothetical protein
MFKKIQTKWKVSGAKFWLIITTFALGGSSCARLAKIILSFINIKIGFTYILLYILFVFLLWPVCVILISIPLGQFSFFKSYLIRVFGKLTGKSKINVK